MPLITREELLKLAKSANLSISDEEMPDLLKRLEDVLGYAVYLKDIAAQQKAEVLEEITSVVRDDEEVSVDPEPFLALAPEREDNFYVVPAILKQQVDHE